MAASSSEPIELRLRDVSQLFNTLDPFPFRERDLSQEAIQYIVEWAQGLPKDRPIHIAVHVPAGDQKAVQDDVASAIAASFAAMERTETKALRQLFRDGERAFLIAIPLLAVCFFIAWRLAHDFEGPFARLLTESFVIIGWVLMWRPLEMCLYDWLPLVRQRSLYRRLAAAKVTVREDPTPLAAAPNR